MSEILASKIEFFGGKFPREIEIFRKFALNKIRNFEPGSTTTQISNQIDAAAYAQGSCWQAGIGAFLKRFRFRKAYFSEK